MIAGAIFAYFKEDFSKQRYVNIGIALLLISHTIYYLLFYWQGAALIDVMRIIFVVLALLVQVILGAIGCAIGSKIKNRKQ